MAGIVPKKVILSPIAEAAGVSISTVSQVINKCPGTRERIERLLTEHGYIPHQPPDNRQEGTWRLCQPGCPSSR